MPVLNLADDVRVGALQVDKVYLGATQVWPGGGGPVDPGPAWFDLDERSLEGGTQVDLGGGVMLLTVWPDQSGNGNDAILDPDDGSDDSGDNGGFVVGSENDHSTVTARYDLDRLTVKCTFPDPDENGNVATVLYMVTLGADAPADGTELVALSFDPSGGNYYQDTYVYDADGESSEITGYSYGEQFGGPQVGDTYIVTRVHTVDNTVLDDLPLSHVDGFEAAPQTDYSGSSGDIFGPDVMIGNYPGGGYTLAGRWRRVVAYPGRLNAAQRSAARDLLIAQAAEDGITVTKYPETTTDPSDVIGIVVGPDAQPYAGADVYAIANTQDHETLGETTTGGDGSYTIPALPFGSGFAIAVHPTTIDEAITYPRFGSNSPYLAGAEGYTVDGSGDPIDIGTLTMLTSIDPTTDPDLVESYDSTDLASLTVTTGRVTAWAAQQIGRPPFGVAAGLGPTTGVRTLAGANMLGFTGESPDAVMTAAADNVSGDQTIILVGQREGSGPFGPSPDHNRFLRADATDLLIWYGAVLSYITLDGNNGPSGATYSQASDDGRFATVASFGAGPDVIASNYGPAIYADGGGSAWTINPTWTDLSLVGDHGYTWAVRYVARIARKITVDDAARMCSWLVSTMLPES